ncbi:MAG: DUF6356 family protein [Actinomycetota bacterium]
MGIFTKFTEHPNSVDETYVEHMGVAFGFAWDLAKASGQAAVHAVFPFMCCSSASSRVNQIQARMTSGARADNATNGLTGSAPAVVVPGTVEALEAVS